MTENPVVAALLNLWMPSVFLRRKILTHLVGQVKWIKVTPMFFIFVSNCLETTDVSNSEESDEDDDIFSSRFTARRKIASPTKSTHSLEFHETRFNKTPKASTATSVSSPNKQPPLSLTSEKEQQSRPKAADVLTDQTVVRESISLSVAKSGKSKLGNIQLPIAFLKFMIIECFVFL